MPPGECREKAEDVIENLHERIKALEEEAREDIPARSLDYHLWSIFFTVGFLVLSFVFSGDMEHYIKHLSTPAVSLSVSKENPDTLVLTRYGIKWLHSNTKPKNISIILYTKKIDNDKPFDLNLLNISYIDDNDRHTLGSEFYSVKYIENNLICINIESFGKNIDFINHLYIIFPSKYREKAEIDKIGYGIEVDKYNNLAYGFWGNRGSGVWYAHSLIIVFIFGVFIYVLYFNIKTFFKYMAEFQNYAAYVYKWITLIGLQRLTSGRSEAHDSVLTEDSLIAFYNGNIEKISDKNSERNNSDAKKYLMGRSPLKPYKEYDGIRTYKISLSPGKYQYWRRAFKILNPISFYVYYAIIKDADGKERTSFQDADSDWNRHDIKKFIPIVLPIVYNKLKCINIFRWINYYGAFIYLIIVGLVVAYIIVTYVQAISSSLALIIISIGVFGYALARDILFKPIGTILKQLFQVKDTVS